MQGYCDVYKWTILKRTSPEVKCLHPTSSRREMCTLSVSNVIYHKFSHGAAFYTLNGKNVNVMLEYRIATLGLSLILLGLVSLLLFFSILSLGQNVGPDCVVYRLLPSHPFYFPCSVYASGHFYLWFLLVLFLTLLVRIMGCFVSF